MILTPDQLIWNYDDMTGCQKGQKTRFHWISIGHRNLNTNHTPGCTITEGWINIEHSKFCFHSPISKFCGHSPKTTPLVSGFHLWYNLWALVWRKTKHPHALIFHPTTSAGATALTHIGCWEDSKIPPNHRLISQALRHSNRRDFITCLFTYVFMGNPKQFKHVCVCVCKCQKFDAQDRFPSCKIPVSPESKWKNERNKTNTTHELFYNQHEFFITETDKPNIQQIYKTTFQDQLVDLVDLLDLV